MLDTLWTRAAVSDDATGSTPRESRRGDASVQANCREVEVELDEGYGVSSHEKRYVCDPAP